MEVLEADKVKGHQLLSMLGKKVLRPGGIELSEYLIEAMKISPYDDIVELAPGMGHTAKIILDKHPHSYHGVDIDSQAIFELQCRFQQKHIHFIEGNADNLPLENESVCKIIGEAMLTMYVNHRKKEIMSEANRVLKIGGLYGIHELAVITDSIAISEEERIKKEMTYDLANISHVNARPLTIQEWTDLLEEEGFRVKEIKLHPMKLLQPQRMVKDEGFVNTMRIVKNIIRNSKARKRVLSMRKIFKKYEPLMKGIVIIAEKVN